MSEAWYAVYTRFQHEKSAARLLEGKGFEILLPLYQSLHRWKDRNKLVTLPLFPCYLFLKTALARRVEVLKTPGVRWIVGNTNGDIPVPEGEIDAIRRVASTPSRIQPHPFLRHGQAVRVRSGPLEGLEGILTRVKNQFRVVISVELVQRSVAVEVDLSDVASVFVSRKPASQFSPASQNISSAAGLSYRALPD